MKRRNLLVAIACAALANSVAKADPQKSFKRIGFLGTATQVGYAGYVDKLCAGLGYLGWDVGKNLQIDFVWANSDYSKLPELAQQLVSTHPDLLITHGTPGTRALQAATRDIPIVIAVSGEAAASGLVKSFSNPGGNTTGQSYLGAEISAKRIELLLEASPSVRRFAAVYNSGNPFAQIDLRTLHVLTDAQGIEFKPFDAKGRSDLDSIFSELAQEQFQAVSIIHDSVLTAEVATLAKLSLKHHLISIGEGSFAKAGGLIGYGPDFGEMWRKTAVYVDKILKGARPSDLPVEVPSKFETLLNLRTAGVLGLNFPSSLLARADELLE